MSSPEDVVVVKPDAELLEAVKNANREMATRILSGIETHADLGKKLLQACERLERPIQRMGMLSPCPLEQNEALQFALAMIVATTIGRVLGSNPQFGSAYLLEAQIKNALEQTLSGVRGIAHVERKNVDELGVEEIAPATPPPIDEPREPSRYSKGVLDSMPGFVAAPPSDADEFFTLLRNAAGMLIAGIDTQQELGSSLTMSLARLQMIFAKAIAGGKISQQESIEFSVHMLGSSAMANVLESEVVTYGNGSLQPRLAAWVDKLLKRSIACGKPKASTS